MVVGQGEDSFRLRGFIDRVDRAPDGRVRVIDYKTAGPWAYTKKAVTEGKKLQLPLYALAARDALRLGDPAEGFYWHVRQAESSSFQMSKFEGGPEGAMEVAGLYGGPPRKPLLPLKETDKQAIRDAIKAAGLM